MRLFKITISLLLFSIASYTQSGQIIKGKILETATGGGYTYLLLETATDKVWVATTEIPVKVGQEIELQSGMVMENFQSKSLNRVFDKIIFSTGLASAQAKKSQGHGHGHGVQKKAPKTVEDPISALSSGSWKKPAADSMPKGTVETVTKADGPNSYTIEEIYQSGTKLNLKPVRIKGEVIKSLSQIMGKNWIHLQDGTGDESKGTHDLVITSQDLPEVGQVVTMMGTLYTNKDFGAGYSYKIIVEEASVMK